MRALRAGLVGAVVLFGSGLFFGQQPADAVQRYGPLQLSGNLESQNIFRHPEVDRWLFIQQRNTLRIRLDADIVQYGKGTMGFDVPGVKSATFFLLYRPVYDSVFDIRPGGRLDSFPRGKDGSLNDFEEVTRVSVRRNPAAPGSPSVTTSSFDPRDEEREANASLMAFREVFVDVTLDAVPLTLRAGRQQVVWGETDKFRMLDRVNPLDLTWHLSVEAFDQIRKPLWMLKALYQLPNIGPLSEVFFEGYWGLGDWTPGEVEFQPHPWGVNTPDPFINPAACGDPDNSFSCDRFETFKGVPFRKGNYHSDPIDNGQWGARLVFNTPQGIQLGLHYFYQRFSFDDSSQPTFLRPLNIAGPSQGGPGPTEDPLTNNLIMIGDGTLPVVVSYPYIHTLGISANYDDAAYTQTVYRLETIYELDHKFPDRTKPHQIRNPDCVGAPSPVPCAAAPAFPSGFFFPSDSDMWKGMIAFDRPTWIRWISKRNTIFFTGQFFWHYMVSNPENFNGTKGVNDKIRRWETLWTLAATSFLGRGGTFVPLVFIGVDPTNEWSIITGWSANYFVTNNLIVSPFQNYYFVPFEGGSVDQPWPLGGFFRQNDETGLKLTWQF